MLEIYLFVLFLQIGFNTALNYRDSNQNPLIPSARFVNYGQARRYSDSDRYLPLSSREIPNSESEQSDSEYTSLEETNFRSLHPLQNLLNQRRNNYLRYYTESENDASLELSPVGRIGSNNYVENLQSSSPVSHRSDRIFRPDLRHRPLNLRRGQKSKHYKKEYDDLSLGELSVHKSSSNDADRAGEDASYLESRKSLIKRPNKRRNQNHEYYRKDDNLSLNVPPIDRLDSDEDAVNSEPTSAVNLDYVLKSLLSSLEPSSKRRNNHKENQNHEYDSQFLVPPKKDNLYIDTDLLDSDEDNTTVAKPKLRSSKLASNSKNNNYIRRHGTISNIKSNNLSPFSRLKSRLRKRKLPNEYANSSHKYNRKNNNNVVLASLLNDKLFSNDHDSVAAFLRLSSLENLNLETVQLKSRDKKQHSNRPNNRMNFLTLSFSPNDKLTLDEDEASDLSELLSETLDEVNLEPVSFRISRPLNKKHTRRENVDEMLDLSLNDRLNTEKDTLSSLPVLRLGSLDNLNAKSSGDRKPTNCVHNKKLRRQENNKSHETQFDKNAAENLVPYREQRSKKPLINSINESENINKKQNNNRRNANEFSLETLFNNREKDNDDSGISLNEELDLDDNFESDLSVLHSSSLENLSLEPSLLRNPDENQSILNNTTDTLEFPWNEDKNRNLSVLPGLGLKSQSHKQNDDSTNTTDVPHFEFPWNDQLNPDNNKNTNLSALSGFGSQLRSSEKNNKTTDNLPLEFIWNDILGPKESKSSNLSVLLGPKSQLRSREQKHNSKGTTDTLQLEFSWNDQLSPDEDKSSNLSVLRELKSQSRLRSHEKKDDAKHTTDVLHLEFPWNDQLSPDEDTSSNLPVLRELESQSRLRSHEKKDEAKNTTDVLHLEFPWNDQLSPDEDTSSNLPVLRELESQSRLRSHEKKDDAKNTTDVLHLEFPWNDQLSPDENTSSNLSVLRELESQSQLRSHEKKAEAKNTTDVLHLEFPWNDQLSPDEDTSSNLSVLRELESQSQVRSRENKDDDKDTADVLHLEFPWNGQLSPDEDTSINLSVLHELQSQTRLRSHEKKDDSKDTADVLHLEFPWNGQLSPYKDTSSVNTARPAGEPPFIRNQYKHRDYYTRFFKDSLNNEDSVSTDAESYRRQYIRSLNKNEKLQVLFIARESLKNDTNIFKDSDEGPSDFIPLPLDRRPHPRLRMQNTPLYLDQRDNLPLATTTVRRNDMEYIFNNAENNWKA